MEKYNQELSQFISKELIQVAIGQYQIQLHFFSDVSLSIVREIHAQINDQEYICDAEQPESSSPLLQLLGLKVCTIKLSVDDSLKIEFENKDKIVLICEKSEGYESYQIMTSNDYIVF